MRSARGWAGIPSDRVVAVVAQLGGGRVQIGSGYLVRQRLVLTARHCTVDKKTGHSVQSLEVVRRSDGAEASAWASRFSGWMVVLVGSTRVAGGRRRTIWHRLQRSGGPDRSCELHDCQAVGFPLWQLDSRDRQRNAAELHGTIRVTEDAESRRLVLRDALLTDVSVPRTAASQDRATDSPWGGLSESWCSTTAVPWVSLASSAAPAKVVRRSQFCRPENSRLRSLPTRPSPSWLDVSLSKDLPLVGVSPPWPVATPTSKTGYSPRRPGAGRELPK